MKIKTFQILRYDAEDGMVFDWADLASHINFDEEGNEIQEHLYAKTIFLAQNDSIENYIEVVRPAE